MNLYDVPITVNYNGVEIEEAILTLNVTSYENHEGCDPHLAASDWDSQPYTDLSWDVVALEVFDETGSSMIIHDTKSLEKLVYDEATVAYMLTSELIREENDYDY